MLSMAISSQVSPLNTAKIQRSRDSPVPAEDHSISTDAGEPPGDATGPATCRQYPAMPGNGGKGACGSFVGLNFSQQTPHYHVGKLCSAPLYRTITAKGSHHSNEQNKSTTKSVE